MTYDVEYNARSLPPGEIARSFIPPDQHFVRLLSRNHTMVLGPRGSGKTTLLKMLTMRALRNWDHPKANEFVRQITFNAAFIPADITWGKQIEALDSSNLNSKRKEAAFVLHTIGALIYAMREASELSFEGVPQHLEHLQVKISKEQEENFVRLVSNSLRISPIIATLLGLEVALEEKLDQINTGDSDEAFSVDALPSKISLLVRTFNRIIGDDERRWALLFDELEIAPTKIKSFLIEGIRSFDERIIVKLAIAPFMDDVGFAPSPTSPQPLHDYHTVQLTYPNKEDAAQFTQALIISTFNRMGVNVSTLSEIFQSPTGTRGFGSQSRISGKKVGVPKEFKSLFKKDDSFKKFIENRGIFSKNYKFNEKNNSRDIRKILPIVVSRDFYLRLFKSDGKKVRQRSRKSYELYTGYPSVAEITEGNPRAILTLIAPLAQWQISQGKPKIPVTVQGTAIRRVELLLTSLLQVIPLDLEGFEPGKGLLEFIDKIGRAFEDRLLMKPFSTDYVGTFVLDQNSHSNVVNAVGKAINAGALIHVPYPGSGPDILLRGMKGQRFRLSFALAPRFRLLLTLGDRLTLSKLLSEMRGVDIEAAQLSLFEGRSGND